MTLPTAEWCREEADHATELAEVCDAAGHPDTAKYDRQTAIALRIAARVLDEEAEEKLARIIYPEYGEPRSAADTARSILAYLKGEAS